MESDINQLTSGDLFCNAIYTSPGRHKSRFYVERCKRQKYVTVSMSKVGIPNIDIKVWSRKSELPQVNFLHSLTQTEITIKRPFELMYI